jgi:serine/threonine protein kinase
MTHPPSDGSHARAGAMRSDLGIDFSAGRFASTTWAQRYDVGELLGRGSQGVAFAGFDKKTASAVVLKVFDLGKATQWKAVELFDREAAALRTLNHPRMPRLIDVLADEQSGLRVLVMTRVQGAALQQRSDTRVAEARLWRMALDAAELLAHVHQQALVHRDIKPSNLVEQPDGRIGLIDFGGVGLARGTAGSTVVGTFGFMAPEQLYGAQTPATDVYALGATLLALATGCEPEDLPRAGLAIDVHAAAPWLSTPLRQWLSTLTAPDPNARPADGAALLATLQGVAAGTSTLPATAGSTAPAHSKPAPWLQALAGTLGVLSITRVGRVLVPVVMGVLDIVLRDADFQALQALRARASRTAGLVSDQLNAQRKKRRQRRPVITIGANGKPTVDASWPGDDG